GTTPYLWAGPDRFFELGNAVRLSSEFLDCTGPALLGISVPRLIFVRPEDARAVSLALVQLGSDLIPSKDDICWSSRPLNVRDRKEDHTNDSPGWWGSF